MSAKKEIITKKTSSSRTKKCLECLTRKRKKGKTRCATCIRKYDVGYWGKKAWIVFAKWLKASRMTFQGYFVCYTCGKTFDIDRAQAGHCFHRGRQQYKALDFDEKHIRLQCGGCNCDQFENGKRNIFQAKLTRELGVEEVEKMIWRRHNEPPLTVSELQGIINKYYEEN